MSSNITVTRTRAELLFLLLAIMKIEPLRTQGCSGQPNLLLPYWPISSFHGFVVLVARNSRLASQVHTHSPRSELKRPMPSTCFLLLAISKIEFLPQQTLNPSLGYPRPRILGILYALQLNQLQHQHNAAHNRQSQINITILAGPNGNCENDFDSVGSFAIGATEGNAPLKDSLGRIIVTGAPESKAVEKSTVLTSAEYVRNGDGNKNIAFTTLVGQTAQPRVNIPVLPVTLGGETGENEGGALMGSELRCFGQDEHGIGGEDRDGRTDAQSC